MNTKLLKIFLIFIMMFYVFNCVFSISYAEDGGGSWESTLTELDGSTDSTKASEKVRNVMTTIMTVVKIVGIAVAIVILLVIAMKYMVAAPGDKADIKKSLIPYLIGAIIIFGAIGILQIIESISQAIK